MSDRINDQLAELKAGQARQESKTEAMGNTLKDLVDTLRQITREHDQRIRRVEVVVVAIALGGGTTAAKFMGFL